MEQIKFLLNIILNSQERPPSYPGGPKTSDSSIEASTESKTIQNNSAGTCESSIVNMISINGIIMAKYLDNQAQAFAQKNMNNIRIMTAWTIHFFVLVKNLFLK